MTSRDAPMLCPDGDMLEMTGMLQRSPADGEARLASLIDRFPEDGRLVFLSASMLAGARQYEDARAMMARAVRLSPYLWIARFQLGLLELTSGAPSLALATWKPLHELAREHPLVLFASGLEALIEDRFEDAIRDLRLGIEANVENPPLNRDMQMMIDRIAAREEGSADHTPMSATQLLLQNLGRGDQTKH